MQNNNLFSCGKEDRCVLRVFKIFGTKLHEIKWPINFLLRSHKFLRVFTIRVVIKKFWCQTWATCL